MYTFTDLLHLVMPARGDKNWDADVSRVFSIIDKALQVDRRGLVERFGHAGAEAGHAAIPVVVVDPPRIGKIQILIGAGNPQRQVPQHLPVPQPQVRDLVGGGFVDTLGAFLGVPGFMFLAIKSRTLREMKSYYGA